MKNFTLGFVLILALILASIAFGKARATPTAPDFHSCDYLQALGNGDKAHYEGGTHQIAGGRLLEGSDDVYSANGGNATQCFCPTTGVGIQTNWMKTETAPDESWESIGNGTYWNLDDANYYYLNLNWECNKVIPSPTPTPNPTPNPTVPILPRTGAGP